MIPAYNKIHLKFKLNGNNYNHEELKEVAYSLVKEGQPYERVIGDFLLDWLDDKNYIQVKTSGSTGEQKRINISKQAMVNSTIATGDFLNIRPGDTALHCLPTNYIAGKMMLVRAMILGLEIDMVEPIGSPVYDYEKHYDFCAMIPMQLQKSILRLHSMDTIIVGGAKVSSQLTHDLQSVSSRVYETFGMTETVSHIAMKAINHGSGNTFKILPKITISQDDRSCLVIEAPELSENKIITNDIVKLHSETEFEWIGRYDNVINSGGIKLFPERIEAKLQDKIEQRFFIASKSHDTLGQCVVLVLENESNTLDASVFEDLETYEIPKHVYAISKFTETLTGKVQRQETLKMC